MQMMLLVDHTKCTGCRLCEQACAVKHTGVNNPNRARIHIMKWPLQGVELPMLCVQCEQAPCIAACPKEALVLDQRLSRVAWDAQRCIGCRMCVMVCPLGAVGVDPGSRKVIKCDLCDGDPVCVRFCDPGALRFVATDSVDLTKKREAGVQLFEIMRKLPTAGKE